MASGSERKRELRRRRHRKVKVTKLKKRLIKATVSERGEIARKLRALTPGGDDLIAALQLTQADR